MQLSDENSSMELGFELVASGEYNWEIDEGIQLNENENSGKKTLWIPLVVESVIEGAGEEGGKAMYFIPIESEFGERQLSTLLTMTGLVHKFMEKFGSDFDPLNDDKSLNALKLKLPGKIVRATHIIKPDKSGTDRINFTKIEASIRGDAKKMEKKAAGKKAAGKDSSKGGDDW